MDSRSRTLLLLILGVGLALGVGCVFLVGLQVYDALYSVPSREERPHLYAVPQPLVLTPCRIEQGTPLSYSGFTVDVPWTGIGREEPYQSFTRVDFVSGMVVLLGRIEDAEGPVSLFRNQDEETRRGLDTMLGQEAMQSPYGFYEFMLNTTPESISIRKDPRKLMGLRMVLNMKDVMLPWGRVELYSFRTDTIQGFQISGGSRNSAELLAFDSPNSGLAITILPPKDSAVRVSQEEINCIIQSIRPAADKPADSN